MVKINLTPEQIQEIKFARKLIPVANIAKQYHIGYGRIYDIWRQDKPDSIRNKVSSKDVTIRQLQAQLDATPTGDTQEILRLTQDNQRLTQEIQRLTEDNHRHLQDKQKLLNQASKILEKYGKEKKNVTEKIQEIKRISKVNKKLTVEMQSQSQEILRLTQEVNRLTQDNQRLSLDATKAFRACSSKTVSEIISRVR